MDCWVCTAETPVPTSASLHRPPAHSPSHTTVEMRAPHRPGSGSAAAVTSRRASTPGSGAAAGGPATDRGRTCRPGAAWPGPGGRSRPAPPHRRRAPRRQRGPAGRWSGGGTCRRGHVVLFCGSGQGRHPPPRPAEEHGDRCLLVRAAACRDRGHPSGVNPQGAERRTPSRTRSRRTPGPDDRREARRGPRRQPAGVAVSSARADSAAPRTWMPRVVRGSRPVSLPTRSRRSDSPPRLR